MSRKRTFRVLRYDPAKGGEPVWQSYETAVAGGTTVLEALSAIRSEQDGTLAFRSACRGAVCGSCAMSINGRVDLACRVQVAGLAEGDVTVEPLPHHPVLKDLVVDLDRFFESVASIQPWLQPSDEDPERERPAAPEALLEPDPYVNCILCASCHAVCPVVERNPEFLGPAVLARQYRFLTDPRDGAGPERRKRVDSENGVWGCDMVWQCVKVCPQGVPPTEGIARIRARIKLDEA